MMERNGDETFRLFLFKYCFVCFDKFCNNNSFVWKSSFFFQLPSCILWLCLEGLSWKVLNVLVFCDFYLNFKKVLCFTSFCSINLTTFKKNQFLIFYFDKTLQKLFILLRSELFLFHCVDKKLLIKFKWFKVYFILLSIIHHVVNVFIFSLYKFLFFHYLELYMLP